MTRTSRLVLIRTVGVVSGVVLTAVALWLIVTSTTQKSLEIGVLLGIWGVVIAASTALSNRSQDAPRKGSGDEVAVRSSNEMVPMTQLIESRTVRAQLEKLLRTELRAALAAEVEGLRAEVAELRQELVDGGGGQLRLERVETTRVIGSDLETMHQQLKRLSADEAPVPHERTVDAEVVDDPADVHAPAGEPGRRHVAEGYEASGSEYAADPAPSQSALTGQRARNGGRRRAEDAEEDILSRILARERH